MICCAASSGVSEPLITPAETAHSSFSRFGSPRERIWYELRIVSWHAERHDTNVFASAFVTGTGFVSGTTATVGGIARAVSGVNAAGTQLQIAVLASTALDIFKAAIDKAATAHGGLDTVVAAAGIALTGSVLQMAEADWHRTIAVNLTGTFLACESLGVSPDYILLSKALGGGLASIGIGASLSAIIVNKDTRAWIGKGATVDAHAQGDPVSAFSWTLAGAPGAEHGAAGQAGPPGRWWSGSAAHRGRSGKISRRRRRAPR